MYRQVEFKLFSVLAWVAIFFAVVSIVLLTVFFYVKVEFFRQLSLVFVGFSFLFEVQIFMYKLTIIEKRMLYVVGMSEQHFRIAKKRENLLLVLYFILFWVALMVLIFAFTPAPR